MSEREEDVKAREQRYRDKAVEMHVEDDGIEVDADAKVAESEDGAFVQVWLWVPKHLVEQE